MSGDQGHDAVMADVRRIVAQLGLTLPQRQKLDSLLARTSGGPARGQFLLLRAGQHAAAGELDDALADAEEARQIALRGPDPLLYVQACLQRAGISELAGDRTAALTVLFTCQASLADLLGDRARQPLLRVIDSLRTRWGDPEFEREMTLYRAQFKDSSR